MRFVLGFLPTIPSIFAANLYHILRSILTYTMSNAGNIVNTFVAFRGTVVWNDKTAQKTVLYQLPTIEHH